MIGKKLDKKFEALIVAIKEYSPGADIAGIQKAWRFAKLAHTGQKRLTGDSFVSHPLEVAIKLADWKLDSTSIIAALLHETIEDGGAKRKDIVDEFGEEVALLVDGVTKVTTLRLKGSKETAFIENLRKMLLVMAKVFDKKAEEHIDKMKKKLLKKLFEHNIKAEVNGRKKHLYSLWKKLERPEIDGNFYEIHDIVALRIIVGTVAQCYTALGVVHTAYKPVPHLGISDFIAQPKPTAYRCLHTKVFGPEGRIVEVQIRTFLMHEEAEYGIAAHWAYGDLKASAC